jgi:hypothetical protein
MVVSARDVACRLFRLPPAGATSHLVSIALIAFGIGATVNMALPQPAAAPPEEEEYG